MTNVVKLPRKPYHRQNVRPRERAPDPFIAEVIELVEAHHQRTHEPYSHIAAGADIATSTLYNWYNGRTKRPQRYTMGAVLAHIGYEFHIRRIR